MKIPLLHFNDVYHISQKDISAAHFTTVVRQLREKHGKDTLLLFSGDCFNPSIESSITRGSHMVPVLNELGIDMSCLGNHDFDFGLDNLQRLLSQTNFPWLLSNVVDSSTGKPPAGSERFRILERQGIKVGFVGLVEKEWLETIPNLPETIKHQSMEDVANELSASLRNEHHADIVIALTHCRLPNDIKLANATKGILDLLLGGHDHVYYIGRGCEIASGWKRPQTDAKGTEEDRDCKIVKTATDFRALSELILDIGEDKKVQKISVSKHEITDEVRPDPNMQAIIERVTSKVGRVTKKPLCITKTPFDCRSDKVRLEESAIGNFFTDIMREAYSGSAAGVTAEIGLSCGGTIRGDSIYGPGEITLGDVLDILPFEDPIVLIELRGQAIWDALESALSMYPAQEGRFPIVSGIRIEWNSRKTPGKRLISVRVVDRGQDKGQLDLSRTYSVATRHYMAEGYDGYKALVGAKEIVDEESGLLLSSIVRKYFLGLGYITKQREAYPQNQTCSDRTRNAIHRVMTMVNTVGAMKASENPQTHENDHSSTGIHDALHAHDRESGIRDAGDKCGTGGNQSDSDHDKKQLPIVKPVIDGRLKDIARVEN